MSSKKSKMRSASSRATALATLVLVTRPNLLPACWHRHTHSRCIRDRRLALTYLVLHPQRGRESARTDGCSNQVRHAPQLPTTHTDTTETQTDRPHAKHRPYSHATRVIFGYGAYHPDAGQFYAAILIWRGDSRVVRGFISPQRVCRQRRWIYLWARRASSLIFSPAAARLSSSRSPTHLHWNTG